MKFKLLTANSDIACLVGFGGLSTISCFVIFFPEYAIYLSIAAFILSLWGMLSLKQIETSNETKQIEKTSEVYHKPHSRNTKQRLTTPAVLILLWGVLLFSATIFVDATLTKNPRTREQTCPDCPDDGKKPELGLICPNPKTPCQLDTVEQRDKDNSIGGIQ